MFWARKSWAVCSLPFALLLLAIATMPLVAEHWWHQNRNKAIVVSLQSPYDIEQGIQPGAYVAAFNSYPAAFKAICPVLYGQHPAVGVFKIPPA